MVTTHRFSTTRERGNLRRGVKKDVANAEILCTTVKSAGKTMLKPELTRILSKMASRSSSYQSKERDFHTGSSSPSWRSKTSRIEMSSRLPTHDGFASCSSQPRKTLIFWACALLMFLLSAVVAQPVNVALNKPVTARYTCGVLGMEYFYNTDDISIPSNQRKTFSCTDIKLSGDESSATYPARLMVDGSQSTAWISASRIMVITQASLTLEQHNRRLEAVLAVDLLQEFVAERITVHLGLGLTPQKVAIFRSLNGQDYFPWVYKVVDPAACAQFFQWTLKSTPTSHADVICTSFTADAVAPGDVIETNFTSVPTSLQEWKRVRYIRLEFYDMQLTIFNFMGDRFNHYSVAELEVLAECPCNGHETGCDVNNVTGIYECVCGGNTKGRYCEMCQDFYNQYPFQYEVPCKACFCYNHATVCYYDSTVAAINQSLNADGVRDGGGVCQDCRNNTAGINCEMCAPFFYRPVGKLQTDLDACQACSCSAAGSTINPTSNRLDCVMNSDVIVAGKTAGDCFCKLNVQGSKCDTCKAGFFNLRQDNALGCQACACDAAGSVDGSQVCSPDVIGQCPCKQNVQGRQCNACKDGYFGLQATNLQGCTSCDCDPGGAVSGVCDKLSGQCACRSINIINTKCDSVMAGFYFPGLHDINAEAENARDAEWVSSPDRPGYMGVGYAVLNSQTATLVVEFPGGTRLSGRSMILLRYQTTSATNVTVTVSSAVQGQGSVSFLLPVCALTWCHVATPNTTTFTFRAGTNTVTVTSTGTVYLDRIVALPEEYLNSQSLLGDRYQALCDVINNNMQLGTSLEAQCRQDVFSITMYHWGSPRACMCDVEGSTNSTCAAYGGQCTCKAGVTGRRCDKCLPGFYQLTDTGCKACQCPGTNQRCDDVTGQCPCPPNTIGRQCELCAVYHYGLNLETGCQPCNCDPVGSVSLQCDVTSGACLCKTGVGGAKCDQCLDGFFALSTSGCKPCTCNLAGSVNNTCNTTTGQCICKSLTTGVLCDTCLPGSFHLAEGQRDGCLDCVCMGVSSQCASAPVFLQRTSALLAEESTSGLLSKLRLVDSFGNSSGTNPTPVTISGTVTLQVDLDGLNLLYWELPAQFTGDLLKLYSSVITYVTGYDVKGAGIPRELSALLIGANGVTYERSLGQVLLGGERTLTVLFSEAGWRVRGKQEEVTRGQFLLTLSSVRMILVQAVMMTGSHTARISRLEYSTVRPTGTRTYRVEQCVCGPEYTGLSCQSCAAGYKRADVEQHEYLGTCVPCECNKHASTCDPDTGRCLDCRDHTTGFNCELCEAGYYGNATRGTAGDCTMCPCFQPRVINSTCEVQESGVIVCLHCRDGYVGNLCDRCADFHYGNPQVVLTGTCTPCNCNNNSDVCDTATGVCINCQNNTTGLHCETCVAGYYGNASAQECQGCGCSMAESVSTVCDHVTGQCACRAGVGGRSCDACLPDYWGYDDGLNNGCEPCGCVAAGSVSTQCGGADGHCACNPNALGNKCDTCQAGYFGLPHQSCQPCDCDITGTVTDVTVCNNVTGQCQCKPGVTERRCDACLPLYTGFGLDGCTACGQCQSSLGKDIQSLVDVWSRDDNVTASVLAMVQLEAKLVEVQKRLNDTLNDLGLSGNDLTSLSSTLNALTETQRLARENVTSLQGQMLALQTNVEALKRQADAQKDRLEVLLTESESVLNQLVTSRQTYNELIDLMVANNLSAYEMLDSVVEGAANMSFQTQLAAARAQLAIVSGATYLTAMTSLLQTQAVNITRLKTLADDMEARIRARRDLVFSLAEQVEQLVLQEDSVGPTQADAQAFKNQSLADEEMAREELIAAQEVLANGSATWQTALQEVQQTGRLLRGNAVGDAPQEFLPLPPGVSNWETGAGSLRAQLDVTEASARNLSQKVASAETHAQSLTVAAQLLNQTFQAVQPRGQEAVQAIESFQVALETLNSSLEVAQAAATTMEQVHADLAAVSTESLQQQALGLKADAEALRAQLNSLSYEHEVLQVNVDVARANVERAVSSWGQVEGQLSDVEESAQALTASAADPTVTQQMTQAQTRANEAQAAADTVASYVTSQEVKLTLREAEAANVSNKVTQTNALISNVEYGLDTYQNSRRTLATQLRDVNSLASLTGSTSQAIENTLASIESKLQQAQELLNRITLPVVFDGSAGLSLDNPVVSKSEIYSDVTLTFRRDTGVKDGLLFFTEHTATGGELEIRLQEGKVVFEFNTNLDLVTITSPAVICDGCWGRVLASRYGNTGHLTVTLLATGGSVTRSQAGVTSSSLLTLNSPFFLADLPANYTTTKTAAPNFRGCVLNVLYNDLDLDIWKKATETLTGVSCCRSPISQAGSPTVTGASFYGFGHLVLQTAAQMMVSQVSSFSFQFRTYQRNAALLSLQNPADRATYAILLDAGHVTFQFGFGGVMNTLQSTRQYGDGRWCQVTASHNSTTMTLKVTYPDLASDTPDLVTRSVAPVDLSPLASGDLVLGTAIHPNSEIAVMDYKRFAGCIRNLQYMPQPGLSSVSANFTTGVVSSADVTSTGCWQSVVDGLSFLTTSAFARLATDSALLQLTSLQFDLLTSRPQGILLHIASPASQLRELYLGLFHGNLVLYVRQTTAVTLNTRSLYLSDGLQHTVKIDFTQYRPRLTVDGSTYEDQNSPLLLQQPYIAFTTLALLHLGGVSDDVTLRSEFPARRSLIGGIRNLYINGLDSANKIDFFASGVITVQRDVSLAGIAAPSDVTPPPPYTTVVPSTTPPPPTCTNATVPARLGLEQGVYMTGKSPIQWNQISVLDAPIATLLNDSFVLSMKLQSYKSDGVLIYAPDTFVTPTQYLAVYLLDGYIHLILKTSSGQVQAIRSTLQYNDARVHQLDIMRINDFAAIIVTDTKDYVNTNQNSSLNSALKIFERNEMFIGGLTSVVNAPFTPFPDALKNQAGGLNFVGTLYEVSLGDDQTRILVPWMQLDRTVYPAIYSRVRYGVRLSGTNSSLSIPPSALSSSTMQTFEIKVALVTTSSEANLLTIYEMVNGSQAQYITLDYKQGQLAVQMAAPSGQGQAFIFLFPHSIALCDGQPHVLTLEVSGSEVILQVDSTLMDDKPFPAFFMPPQFSPAAARVYLGGVGDAALTFLEPVVTQRLAGCVQWVTFDSQPTGSTPAVKLDPTRYIAISQGADYGCPY